MSEGLSTDVARLTAEVDHWKAHAQEAGDGFAQVCRDYARVTARNTELRRRVEAEWFNGNLAADVRDRILAQTEDGRAYVGEAVAAHDEHATAMPRNTPGQSGGQA